MTVLIVEESKGNAKAYVRALSHYDVHICTDPSAAPELLDSLRPDALVVNLFTLSDIASLPYRPRIILALTYFVSDDVLEWAAAVGIQEMILLPCSTKYLAARIGELLAQPIH